MDYRKAAAAVMLLALSHAACAAPVRVEIATEAPPQATAQQGWLQLLAGLGVSGVRIRQATPREEPRIEEQGAPKLIALLSRDNVLHAPGARFTTRDRARLREYLDRLAGDGAEGVTAARGRFGLTEKEFTLAFEALSLPLAPAQPGGSLAEVVAAQRARLPIPLEVDPQATRPLGAVAEGAEHLRGLSAGTGLALLLKQEGLALVVEKPPGGSLAVRVIPSVGRDETWPVGYKPEGSPREIAPALFEWVNVEIDRFSLQQAVEAIAQRITKPERPLPVVWDHFALRAAAIDPAKTPVRLAPTRTFYKRVLDRLVTQARLRAELRVDEAGAPFVLLSR